MMEILTFDCTVFSLLYVGAIYGFKMKAKSADYEHVCQWRQYEWTNWISLKNVPNRMGTGIVCMYLILAITSTISIVISSIDSRVRQPNDAPMDFKTTIVINWIIAAFTTFLTSINVLSDVYRHDMPDDVKNCYQERGEFWWFALSIHYPRLSWSFLRLY